MQDDCRHVNIKKRLLPYISYLCFNLYISYKNVNDFFSFRFHTKLAYFNHVKRNIFILFFNLLLQKLKKINEIIKLMRFVEHLFAIINRNTIFGLLLLNSCQWDSKMLPSRHERTYERLIPVYSHFMHDWRVYLKFLMNYCILDSFIFKETFAVTYLWSKICFVYSKI